MITSFTLTIASFLLPITLPHPKVKVLGAVPFSLSPALLVWDGDDLGVMRVFFTLLVVAIAVFLYLGLVPYIFRHQSTEFHPSRVYRPTRDAYGDEPL